MQIALESPTRKLALLSATLVVAGLYLFLAGRNFLASYFARSAELGRLQRAVQLAPASAEYHQMLGRLYFTGNNLREAAQQYHIATQLNPHEGQYWLELASLEQITGDVAKQRYALERAIAAEPTTPEVAWEAGNFFLVQGDAQKALRQFRVVLENDPTLTYAALQAAAHVADVNTMLRDVLPPQPDAYLSLIELQIGKKDLDGAAKVWEGLANLGQPFESRRTLHYINYLIQQRDISQARLVWRQMAQRCGLTAYLPSHDNLVVNPSFSLDILNSGFDWHYLREHSVELELDPTDFHGGHRSLSIAFEGPGVSEAGIFQFIPVEPDTSYEFSAYYKSDKMDGAGGPRFAVQDAYSNASYFESDDLNDADVWRATGGQFKTSPDAQLVVIRLLRVPSGSAIRGRLWIDDFRLVEKHE
jgi:tetratricopeptide (TPR) repeat protein